jgi:hypothetical protein
MGQIAGRINGSARKSPLFRPLWRASLLNASSARALTIHIAFSRKRHHGIKYPQQRLCRHGRARHDLPRQVSVRIYGVRRGVVRPHGQLRG